jgi:hypothetical protein
VVSSRVAIVGDRLVGQHLEAGRAHLPAGEKVRPAVGQHLLRQAVAEPAADLHKHQPAADDGDPVDREPPLGQQVDGVLGLGVGGERRHRATPTSRPPTLVNGSEDAGACLIRQDRNLLPGAAHLVAASASFLPAEPGGG